jgi:hypothetical protein
MMRGWRKLHNRFTGFRGWWKADYSLMKMNV